MSTYFTLELVVTTGVVAIVPLLVRVVGLLLTVIGRVTHTTRGSATQVLFTPGNILFPVFVTKYQVVVLYWKNPMSLRANVVLSN